MSIQQIQPELPYNGTSGHSGTDTSKGRALDADRSGKTALRQAQALNLLGQRQVITERLRVYCPSSIKRDALRDSKRLARAVKSMLI
jgi:hypothetical protein